MIAILSKDCPLADKASVVRLIEAEGCRVVVSETENETRMGVVGSPSESLVPGSQTEHTVAPQLA